MSLDASIFHHGILRYTPLLRDEILDFQAQALRTAPLLRRGFDGLNRCIDRRPALDVQRVLSPLGPEGQVVRGKA